MQRRSIAPLEKKVIDEIEDELGKEIPMFDYFVGNRVFGLRVIKSHIYLLLVNNRGLTTLPDTIGHLRSLRALDVGRNRLKSLPPSISLCQDLTQLFLGRNHLEYLDKAVYQLSRLKILEIQYNRITHLFPLDPLQDLELLYIQGNRLTQPPQGLTSLDYLEELRLDDNLIESINNLNAPQLKHLNLSHNRIKSIQLEGSSLPHLTTLQLRGNQLTEFPTMLEMNNLEELDLSDNQLLHIDYEVIGALPSLRILDLRGNPLNLKGTVKLDAFSKLLPHRIELLY